MEKIEAAVGSNEPFPGGQDENVRFTRHPTPIHSLLLILLRPLELCFIVMKRIKHLLFAEFLYINKEWNFFPLNGIHSNLYYF